jgi:hypothetical protein
MSTLLNPENDKYETKGCSKVEYLLNVGAMA